MRPYVRQLIANSQPLGWIETAGPYILGLVATGRLLGWQSSLGILFFLLPYNLLLRRADHWLTWMIVLPLVIALGWSHDAALWGLLLADLGLVAALQLPPWHLARSEVWPIIEALTKSVAPFVIGLLVAGSLHLHPWLVLGLGLWGLANTLYDVWPTEHWRQRLAQTLYLAVAVLAIWISLWPAFILALYLGMYQWRRHLKLPDQSGWEAVHWVVWVSLGWWLIWAKAPNPALWAGLALLGANLVLAVWTWWPIDSSSLITSIVTLRLLGSAIAYITKFGQPAFSAALHYDETHISHRWGLKPPVLLTGFSVGLILLMPYLLIWQFVVLTNRWAPLLLLAAIIVQLAGYLLSQPPLWTALTYPLLVLTELPLMVVGGWRSLWQIQPKI